MERAWQNIRLSRTYPVEQEQIYLRLDNLYHAQQFVFYLHFNCFLSKDI